MVDATREDEDGPAVLSEDRIVVRCGACKWTFEIGASDEIHPCPGCGVEGHLPPAPAAGPRRLATFDRIVHPPTVRKVVHTSGHQNQMSARTGRKLTEFHRVKSEEGPKGAR